jgi:hypothetical protein
MAKEREEALRRAGGRDWEESLEKVFEISQISFRLIV